ncbi:hypothetical protein FNF31_00861 [Cafeteria roenbergensis]|uniref:EF-hand domain-containing protein n=2 Tax=Cafeteria roenbergensis TaxID=33653 RepID=A0A5A8DQJ4_CAFRO|nr:hypothetical protein FNF31_00861 [Cafeteria roenbergensis]KAA0172337.1 hypothetical protein FNF28_00022 [Cafeteria roenbergensis]
MASLGQPSSVGAAGSSGGAVAPARGATSSLGRNELRHLAEESRRAVIDMVGEDLIEGETRTSATMQPDRQAGRPAARPGTAGSTSRARSRRRSDATSTDSKPSRGEKAHRLTSLAVAMLGRGVAVPGVSASTRPRALERWIDDRLAAITATLETSEHGPRVAQAAGSASADGLSKAGPVAGWTDPLRDHGPAIVDVDRMAHSSQLVTASQRARGLVEVGEEVVATYEAAAAELSRLAASACLEEGAVVGAAWGCAQQLWLQQLEAMRRGSALARVDVELRRREALQAVEKAISVLEQADVFRTAVVSLRRSVEQARAEGVAKGFHVGKHRTAVLLRAALLLRKWAAAEDDEARGEMVLVSPDSVNRALGEAAEAHAKAKSERRAKRRQEREARAKAERRAARRKARAAGGGSGAGGAEDGSASDGSSWSGSDVDGAEGGERRGGRGGRAGRGRKGKAGGGEDSSDSEEEVEVEEWVEDEDGNRHLVKVIKKVKKPNKGGGAAGDGSDEEWVEDEDGTRRLVKVSRKGRAKGSGESESEEEVEVEVEEWVENEDGTRSLVKVVKKVKRKKGGGAAGDGSDEEWVEDEDGTRRLVKVSRKGKRAGAGGSADGGSDDDEEEVEVEVEEWVENEDGTRSLVKVVKKVKRKKGGGAAGDGSDEEWVEDEDGTRRLVKVSRKGKRAGAGGSADGGSDDDEAKKDAGMEERHRAVQMGEPHPSIAAGGGGGGGMGIMFAAGAGPGGLAAAADAEARGGGGLFGSDEEAGSAGGYDSGEEGGPGRRGRGRGRGQGEFLVAGGKTRRDDPDFGTSNDAFALGKRGKRRTRRRVRVQQLLQRLRQGSGVKPTYPLQWTLSAMATIYNDRDQQVRALLTTVMPRFAAMAAVAERRDRHGADEQLARAALAEAPVAPANAAGGATASQGPSPFSAPVAGAAGSPPGQASGRGRAGGRASLWRTGSFAASAGSSSPGGTARSGRRSPPAGGGGAAATVARPASGSGGAAGADGAVWQQGAGAATRERLELATAVDLLGSPRFGIDLGPEGGEDPVLPSNATGSRPVSRSGGSTARSGSFKPPNQPASSSSASDGTGSVSWGASTQELHRLDLFVSDFYQRRFGLMALADRHVTTLLRCVRAYSETDRMVDLFASLLASDVDMPREELLVVLCVRGLCRLPALPRAAWALAGMPTGGRARQRALFSWRLIHATIVLRRGLFRYLRRVRAGSGSGGEGGGRSAPLGAFDRARGRRASVDAGLNPDAMTDDQLAAAAGVVNAAEAAASQADAASASHHSLVPSTGSFASMQGSVTTAREEGSVGSPQSPAGRPLGASRRRGRRGSAVDIIEADPTMRERVKAAVEAAKATGGPGVPSPRSARPDLEAEAATALAAISGAEATADASADAGGGGGPAALRVRAPSQDRERALSDGAEDDGSAGEQASGASGVVARQPFGGSPVAKVRAAASAAAATSWWQMAGPSAAKQEVEGTAWTVWSAPRLARLLLVTRPFAKDVVRRQMLRSTAACVSFPESDDGVTDWVWLPRAREVVRLLLLQSQQDEAQTALQQLVRRGREPSWAQMRVPEHLLRLFEQAPRVDRGALADLIVQSRARAREAFGRALSQDFDAFDRRKEGQLERREVLSALHTLFPGALSKEQAADIYDTVVVGEQARLRAAGLGKAEVSGWTRAMFTDTVGRLSLRLV